MAVFTSTRWSGIVVLGAQPVVDVEADPPVGRHVVEQRQALLSLVADDPSATVDLHQRGTSLTGQRGHTGSEDVEVQRGAGRLAVLRRDG